jgi:hypothetical protein
VAGSAHPKGKSFVDNGARSKSREYLQAKMLQTLKLLKPQIPSIPYSNYQDQQGSDRDTPHTALAYS